MAIGKDFPVAYNGLLRLVGRISGEEVKHEALEEEVVRWFREDCQSGVFLRDAALFALRHELANRSRDMLAGDESEETLERARAYVEALGTVHRSAGSRVEENLSPVELTLPEEHRKAHPRGRAFEMGDLRIFFETFDGPPAAYLSISHSSRYPTWEELQRAADAPGGVRPNLWALLPKSSPEGGISRIIELYAFPPDELIG